MEQTQEQIKEEPKTETKEVAKTPKVAVKKEEKIELSREYVVPLRKQCMKVAGYRKAKKAIRTLKEFLAKHMHVENRDMRLVKLDRYLNQEIWYRGIRNPPAKIKVKAVKKDGIVYAELAEVPEKVKWDMQRDKKQHEAGQKMKVKMPTHKEEKKEETTDIKEKEKSSVEAGQAEMKLEAKQAKHDSKPKQVRQPAKRMVLQK